VDWTKEGVVSKDITDGGGPCFSGEMPSSRKNNSIDARYKRPIKVSLNV